MLNKTIQIDSVQETPDQIKIKSGKTTLSFFKELKAGGPTVAYDQWVTTNIMNFQPPKHEEIDPMEQFENARPTPKSAPHREIPIRNGNDAFGKRLAIHGMINGMLAGGYKITDFDMQLIEDVMALEDRINNALNGSQNADEPPLGYYEN